MSAYSNINRTAVVARIGLSICVALMSNNLAAYEIDTHASVTKAAYDQSVLFTNSTKLKELGLWKSRRMPPEWAMGASWGLRIE